MRFIASSLFLTAFFSTLSLASPFEKRASVSEGAIIAPADGTVVSAGGSYPFDYPVNNWCEAGYTPFDVYILENEPSPSDLNATQGFTDYLYYYDTYLVDNFPSGLPLMGTPPPTTLTMPDLGAAYVGQEVWLTVVQTELYCPPDGHTVWFLASNNMEYSG